MLVFYTGLVCSVCRMSGPRNPFSKPQPRTVVHKSTPRPRGPAKPIKREPEEPLPQPVFDKPVKRMRSKVKVEAKEEVIEEDSEELNNDANGLGKLYTELSC